MHKEKNNKRLFFSAFLTLLGVFAIAAIALYCVYMLWEKAPDVEPEAPKAISAEKDTDSGVEAVSPDRQQDSYTILLVGNDDGNGNTDTIIVGRLDTVNHTMDFVSIPRDTIVNLDWNVRKINAVYAGTANSGGVAIDGLKAQIRNLIGFNVDCYAVIDLNVFVDVVDLMGGIWFDVPQAMHYEDPGQNLYIHIDAGYQCLNGQQAMGVVRYRSGYANGDLGRIETQQKFLKAAASQFISLGNIPNISQVVSLLAKNMDTDLSAANIAFFLRQALMCSSENVNFHTMPNTPDMVCGLSYTFVELEPWLEMINQCLNPYNATVTAANLDAVYKSGGTVLSTSGNLRGAWYYSAVPTTSAAPEPEPSATPEPSPEPEPEPVDPPAESESPEVTPVPPETSPEPEEPAEPEPTPPEDSGEVIIIG